MRNITKCGLLMAALSFSLPWRTSAVILYATGDPAANTTAPAGALAGSGWQYQGNWGAFSGTVIGPHYFITAKHVGGVVGQAFGFNGVPYTTLAHFDDPSSDLRIWQVAETFPVAAPLYSKNDEIGNEAIVIGRGTVRGDAVMVSGELRGWKWGDYDGVQRWGLNTVSSFHQDPNAGSTLQMPFNANGGPNEAHLSTGDSGGAAFILDGVWKLAGIHYATDGPFNTSPSGPGFYAALFNMAGLYTGGEDNWQRIPDLLLQRPSSFYSTRISPRLSWISAILSQPVPEPATIRIQSSRSPLGPFTDTPDASLDSNRKQFAVPLAGAYRFFRIVSTAPIEIQSVSVSGSNLLINY